MKLIIINPKYFDCKGHLSTFTCNNGYFADVKIDANIFIILQDLALSGSKMPTPITLQFHKFQEWVQANQQIYELQSKILDLETAKIR